MCTDQECPEGISKTQQGCLRPAWRQRSYFHGDLYYSLNAITINAALGSEEERGLRIRAGSAPFCTQSLGKSFSSRPPAFPLSHPPALPSKDQGSAGLRLLFLCSPMPSRLPLPSASKGEAEGRKLHWSVSMATEGTRGKKLRPSQLCYILPEC